MHELDLYDHTETVNELLARYGVKFGIYKNNTFKEQLFPFDAIPRIIPKKEFEKLETGLKQRVMALNLFLKDIYGEKKIIRDKVVPEEFIYASSGYLTQCEGVCPVKNIYSHISGIDLVQGKDGEWYILEDNLRVPSGASYPMIAREALLAYYRQFTFKDSTSDIQKTIIMMRRLYRDFSYAPGTTNVSTTAEEALVLGKGVCQDYSHILIALCHLAQIPARYVVGMLEGEGASHAWVEIYDGGFWYALDPTNNLIVSDSHIKISHGRDYKDCLINQGVFTGNTEQRQEISVHVHEKERKE